MTISTMDGGRGETSGLKETAIGLFYLATVGTAFTGLLSLILVVAIGD